MKIKQYIHLNITSMVAAMLIGMLLLVAFISFEAAFALAQTPATSTAPDPATSTTTDEFIITQEITAEIAFVTPASDVIMSPSIPGLTGGTATGTTDVVVKTSNAEGYSMTIAFFDNAGSAAMYNATTSSVIGDYTPDVAAVPDYTYQNNAANGASQFGYSVVAATAADADQTFKNNGTACGTGTNSTAGNCWYAPKVAAETIINRATATQSGGATTTLDFKVHLPSDPTPAVPSGTYTATATLTAFVN